MVRTALALLSLTLLLLPSAASGSTLTFDAAQSCRTAVVPVTVPDCAVTQTGTVTLASCDATSCVVSLTLDALAEGLPVGVQTLESALIAGARTPLCSAQATTTDAASLGCQGELTFTLPIPTACRLIVLETTATSNRVVSGTVFLDLRVCKDGTVARP